MENVGRGAIWGEVFMLCGSVKGYYAGWNRQNLLFGPSNAIKRERSAFVIGLYVAPSSIKSVCKKFM
jgi:hypothetical protein